jgi:opacity protein-like surface antigen
LRNRFEHRFDALGGTWLDKNTYAFFYRLGINLDPENRYKLEAQPVWWKFDDERNFQGSLGVSNQVTSNLTIRLAYTYNDNPSDNRVILQFYYYRAI